MEETETVYFNRNGQENTLQSWPAPVLKENRKQGRWPKVTVDVASYDITGPGGFTKTGTINVAHSATISATIPGIPAGNGYSITLTAVSTDGSTSCAGSAGFNVTAHSTAAVAVHLACHEAPRAGSVSVNGTINVCPVVDGVSANPAEVAVGNPIALFATAHDSDAGPAALSYHWTASSGSLGGPGTSNPTFSCRGPGVVTLTVTVSDGDTTAGCPGTGSVQITCSVPGAGGPAGVYTMAVYGDAPYGTTPTDTTQTLLFPGFITNVNADPDVETVVQVGDIHSGKQFCTQAYDQLIFDMWTAFQDPVVYTPGDNEWTDCHKVAQGGGAYNPTTMQIDYVLDAMGDPVDYASGDPLAEPRPRPFRLLPRRGAEPGREQAAVAVAGAGLRPGAPQRRRLRRERDVRAVQGAVRDRQRAGRLEQRPRRLVRHADGDARPDPGDRRPDGRGFCAGWTQRSRRPRPTAWSRW